MISGKSKGAGRKVSRIKDMYQEIYDICENVEEVVRMFSKELQELDRNTVKFMIEERREKLRRRRSS